MFCMGRTLPKIVTSTRWSLRQTTYATPAGPVTWQLNFGAPKAGMFLSGIPFDLVKRNQVLSRQRVTFPCTPGKSQIRNGLRGSSRPPMMPA